MNRIIAFALISLFLLSAAQCFAQSTQTTATRTAEAQSPGFDTAMKHYRQRHYARAIDEFNQVVQSEPNNAAAYYFMGYAHYTLKHPQQALEAFSKAFQVDPKFDPNPYMWLQ